MTMRNKFHQHMLIAGVVLMSAGCSTLDNAPDSHIDYKSAASDDAGPRLDVPPDLTQLQRNNRYAVPVVGANGVVTASAYTSQQEENKDAAKGSIAPTQVGDVKILREGTQRWLETSQSPELVWNKLEAFWKEQGFNLKQNSPEAGVMETDWAENRAKIPDDLLRRTLGKVFDSIYSTGERDKFRTRVERNPNGKVEIFISHQGAEEVLTGRDKETSIWTARPTDPGLEAEFLMRLMVRLGAQQEVAKAQVEQTTQAITAQTAAAQKTSLSKTATGTTIIVNEGFDRAWRRVGLALDRAGFTVEDRDRSKGLYFVRYVDTAKDDRDGVFSRIFKAKSEDKATMRYQISIKESANQSVVTLLEQNGQSADAAASEKILTVLNDQLQ